jgi:nitrate reductase beta subunit
MLFYVPPLLPVIASTHEKHQNMERNPIAKVWDTNWIYDTSINDIWGTVEQARMPLQYMANMFGAGDKEIVKIAIKRVLAVRIYRRYKTVGDISKSKVERVFQDTGLNADMAENIYYLTSLAKFNDRFVIPASHREQAIEMLEFTGDIKGNAGFGIQKAPERGM